MHEISLVPALSPLKLASSSDSVTIGDDATLTCTLELNSEIVVESDVSLLMVDAQLDQHCILILVILVSYLHS